MTEEREKLCQKCGHSERDHFSCEVGSFCKACDPNVPNPFAWEHPFEGGEQPAQAVPPFEGIGEFHAAANADSHAAGDGEGISAPKRDYDVRDQYGKPLISRDELIREIGELRKERDALIRTCQKTESALAECRKQNEWIPVSKRLPEESLRLVLIRIDPERIKQWAEASGEDNNYRFYEDNYSSEVDMWNTVSVRHWAQNADWLTHWRPLPNPPVEGERQEPVERK